MNNKIENSEALKRVRKWKDEIYSEVKELDINEKFKKIHKMAKELNPDKNILIKK